MAHPRRPVITADLGDPAILAVAILVNDDPGYAVVVINDGVVSMVPVMDLAALVAQLTNHYPTP